ncbi:MAG TPA: hypothetical protein VFA10_14385 [Ktedonobacteraceae bacterium]|nr:hypothetical protein [Ktedonobacteraceae bacterium]
MLFHLFTLDSALYAWLLISSLVLLVGGWSTFFATGGLRPTHQSRYLLACVVLMRGYRLVLGYGIEYAIAR